MAETDVILAPDQQVRVFISSTLEELAADLSSAGRPRKQRVLPRRGGLGLSKRRIVGHSM
jgi:hypothetical protein